MSSLPCLALVVALGTMPAVAADREALLPPSYRDAPLHRTPHNGKPLRFKAPPSQLLPPWRCSGIDVYARPVVEGACPYDPRFAPDFLLDPYATLRLMQPLRPVPPGSRSDEFGPNVPLTGAPPSQLPTTHPAILLPIF